jgi:hypothetical protein
VIIKVQRLVRRLQFLITPAYAFTNYRSQGQTLRAAIIDIANPPSGGRLTLFNIYVALSRGSGRDTIRLLWDFDDDLLLQPLDSDLGQEIRRAECRVWVKMEGKVEYSTRWWVLKRGSDETLLIYCIIQLRWRCVTLSHESPIIQCDHVQSSSY